MTTSTKISKAEMIASVRKAVLDSGLLQDKPQHKKVLADSILSMLVMAKMLGFTRNDVIFMLKDEWFKMQIAESEGAAK